MVLRNFHQWRAFANEAFGVSMFLLNSFCVLQVTRNHLFNFAFIMGPSMLPTINLTGDVFMVDRISPRQGKLGRGDLVLLRSPENPRKVITKRLVGIEGDCVNYIADPANSDYCESVVVPKGHVWVQGDNIHASRDSRQFGPVPYALLQGRVFLRVWPLKEFGSL